MTAVPVPSSPSTVLRQAAKLMREREDVPWILAVADMFDAAADEWESYDLDLTYTGGGAEAVARAYLGTTEGTSHE